MTTKHLVSTTSMVTPLRPAKAILATSIAALVLGIATQAHSQGIFSNSGSLGTSDQTPNVGLSTSKAYIEAIDLGDTGDTTVNGVLFTGSGGSGNPSGTGWGITGTPNQYNGGGTLPDGVLGGLTNKFVYGGNPGTFTLTGLTVGETYVVTFYNRSWEAAGARVQTFTASGASTGTTIFDEDIGATGQGDLNLLRYTFQAATDTQAIAVAPANPGNSFHFYAFTNEQVFNKNWVSGADWTTATWNAAGAPDGVGTNANFAAQGAPTAINLNASQTVGHVQFDGANSWTLSTANASTLSLQTDVGGISVLSTPSGRHTISAPVTLASDVMKSGAGTLVLSGAITDAGKNLAISAGTLEIANGGNQSLSGVISGSGTFAKSGAGTLTLTSAETYTGDTVISGGILKLQQASGTVGTATVANFPGYTFNAEANNLLAGLAPIATTNGSAGTDGTGPSTVLTNGSIPAFSFATTYAVGDNAALTYSLGSSPLGYDLTKVNLFTGWQDNGRSNITLTDISYSTVAAPETFIAIAGTGDNYGGGGSANLASINAVGGVLATGVAAVRFNFGGQQNGWVGYRELEIVGAATGSVLPNGTAVQIASGASLDLNGVTQTIGSLADSGGGGGSVINSAASTPVTLSINPAGGSTTFSGTITEGGTANAISLIKAGSGTQVLSGTNNNYSGVTTFVGGILNVAFIANYGVNSSLGNRAADAAGDVGLIFRGGTLQYTGPTAQSTNRAIRISTVGGATIDASGSNPAATLSFTAASSPDFFENGGNRTLTLTGSNTGDNTFAMAIAEAGGATSLVKSGAGTWLLPNQNSYSGVTTLEGGILNVASIANYGVDSSVGNRPVASDGFGNVGLLFRGGTLQYTGSTAQSTDRAIRISTVGGATIDASGSIPAATLSFTAASSPDFFENPGARTLTLTGTNTGLNTFNMAITEAGVTSVAKNGVGTWVLTGANTYSGLTLINAGALRITTNSGLGVGGFNGGTMTYVADGGALELQGGITVDEHFHFVGAGPAGLGGLRSVSGDNTLTTDFAIDGDSTIGVDGGSLTVSSKIYTDLFTGPGITKVGAGTLNLNGVQEYSTLTTSAGITNISGAFPSGTSTVNANATTNFETSQTLAGLNIGTVPFAPSGAGPEAEFGLGATSEFGAAIVPEPGSLGLLLTAALGLLARRPKRRA